MTDNHAKIYYRVSKRGHWFRVKRVEEFGTFGHGEYLPEQYQSYVDAKKACDKLNRSLK